MDLESHTLHSNWESVKQANNTLQQAVPAWLDRDWNLFRSELEKRNNGNDRQLLVVNSLKVINVGEPQCEESVGPLVGLQNVESSSWVVVYTVDHHLHKVDLVGPNLRLFLICELGHSNLNKSREVLVSSSTDREKDGFSELASTDSVHGTKLVVSEDGLNDINDGLEVALVLSEHGRAVCDVVVKSWKHVLNVNLGPILESTVNKLEDVPHCWRNALGGECTTVDDLKYFVVKVYKTISNHHSLTQLSERFSLTIESVFQSGRNNWYENILEVQQDIWGTLQSKDKSANGLEDTKSSDTLIVSEDSILILATLLNDISNNAQVSVTLRFVSNRQCRSSQGGIYQLFGQLHSKWSQL